MNDFDTWAADVRRRFAEKFGFAPPSKPKMLPLTEIVYEQMMRSKALAQHFGITPGDHDRMAILAHHRLLDDQNRATMTPWIKRHGPHYPQRDT